ncbi:hypothetical protein BY996DRAFT_6558730 [Phakopsora pachyrhizi]|nr:hypothetical protein BY996DRAFT_6558730 [Phakopsora pachyrhizi]
MHTHTIVVEDLVKEDEGMEGQRFWWILLDFKDEEVTVGRYGWPHWKEEEKVGGGAHQGQNGWFLKRRGMDFKKVLAPDKTESRKRQDKHERTGSLGAHDLDRDVNSWSRITGATDL